MTLSTAWMHLGATGSSAISVDLIWTRLFATALPWAAGRTSCPRETFDRLRPNHSTGREGMTLGIFGRVAGTVGCDVWIDVGGLVRAVRGWRAGGGGGHIGQFYPKRQNNVKC